MIEAMDDVISAATQKEGKPPSAAARIAAEIRMAAGARYLRLCVCVSARVASPVPAQMERRPRLGRRHSHAAGSRRF